jgi:hypothetical protein
VLGDKSAKYDVSWWLERTDNSYDLCEISQLLPENSNFKMQAIVSAKKNLLMMPLSGKHI